MPLSYDGQLQRFDITIPRHNYKTWEELYHAMAEWCKKFAFQIEKGDTTGYEHWQCRVNLISKKTCAKLLTSAAEDIGGHWSVTSAGVHPGPKAFNYVLKKDTRIEGPWTDADIPREIVYSDNVRDYYGYQAAGKLYPWQEQVYELAKQKDNRKIHCVVDRYYNSGKSTLAEVLEYEGLAEEIPGVYTIGEDIIQFAMCRPPAPCYVFDMPAAMKKEKMHGMYQGLECLKNGLLFDKRYAAKKKRLETRPQIIVFSNSPPIRSLMAPDRWVVWNMNKDKTLTQEVLDPPPGAAGPSAASTTTEPARSGPAAIVHYLQRPGTEKYAPDPWEL